MTARFPDVLMYHYVRHGTARPAVGYRAMDPATFAAQLDDVCTTRTPVGWPAVRAALDGGPSLPADAVLLTFDDGLVDHHRVVLPALAARGLPAIFFVLVRDPGDGLAVGHALHVLQAALGAKSLRQAVVERLAPADAARYHRLETAMQSRLPSDSDDVWKRPLQRELAQAAAPVLATLVAEHLGPPRDVAAVLYLSRGQLEDLVDAGMTLGGHGVDHPWLDHAGSDVVQAEIAGSAELLAGFGAAPWPFAYPYGGVPARPDLVLGAAGFGAAFTTDPHERTDRFRIGRFDADELGSRPSLAMDGLR